MGVAATALGTYSHRLRWALPWEDVPPSGRCTLKMDRDCHSSATSTNTIEELRRIFAVHGLPEVLVSDNGTAFSSAEFLDFAKRNSIGHIKTAPYHPSSNGQVERAVQTFKDSMKGSSSDTIQTRVSRFLFTYRTRC